MTLIPCLTLDHPVTLRSACALDKERKKPSPETTQQIMPEGWLKGCKHERKSWLEEAYPYSEVKVDGPLFNPNYTHYIFHLSHSRAQTVP